MRYPLAMFLVAGMLTGCASPTSIGLARGYPAYEACQDLSTATQDYFDEFEDFRYSPDDGTGWAKLELITDKATARIGDAIARIGGGIDWDSAAVVTGLLSNSSSSMWEIYNSAQSGAFAPGRSLDLVLAEIETNLYSVTTSACN
jgi:hypothetical protein